MFMNKGKLWFNPAGKYIIPKRYRSYHRIRIKHHRDIELERCKRFEVYCLRKIIRESILVSILSILFLLLYLLS